MSGKILRSIIQILLLFISFSVKAQIKFETKEDSIYNYLLNYTPKNFAIDEVSKPKKRYFETELNSIIKLSLFYEYQTNLKLDDEEIRWLDKQTNQIALAYYLEGKPILLRKISGGPKGCIFNKVEKEFINKKEVTILNFCFTCSGSGNFEDFIKIFNNRINLLLKNNP